MTRRYLRTLALLLAFAILALSACEGTVTSGPEDGDAPDGDAGDGDTDEDGDEEADIPVILPDGDDPLPDGDDKDGDIEEDPIEDGDEEDEEEVPGDPNAYRLTSLVLTVPAEMSGTIAGYTLDAKRELNTQLESRIGSYQINIILRPSTDRVLEFPYLMILLMAEKQGATYISDPENSYDLQVIADANPREFTTQNDLEIAIPLDPNAGRDFTIRKAKVSGQYSEDLSQITRGVLAGVVHEDDANSIVVAEVQNQVITLAYAFFLMGMQPDYTFTEDGKKGYTFVFTFNAEAIVNVIQEGN